jgi:hypothetical protein
VRIDRINYAIYDAGTGELRLEERPYPLDRFLDELQSRRWPPECIDYYLRKRAAAA